MKVQIKEYYKDIKYNHDISIVTSDSRKIINNGVFIAINGFDLNGNDFIINSLENGAKTIIINQNEIIDDEILLKINNNYINLVKVNDTRNELSRLLYEINKKIFDDLIIIGVTGTNGKTTVSTLLYLYLKSIDISSILIGSNGIFIYNGINNEYQYDTLNTTPGIETIYYYLNYAKENKIKYIVMEVSSQGIKECRTKYIPFYVSLLTNITQDHLDYHKSMDDYIYTKLSFINRAKHAIVNSDDDNYLLFLRYLDNDLTSFGFNSKDYSICQPIIKLDNCEFTLRFEDRSYYFKSNITGLYNISNISGFLTITRILNLFDYNSLYNFLNTNFKISGRNELLRINNRIIFIDYAHTPDGVLKVLTFLNTVKENKIITVIGMGGNRDNKKRSVVGLITNELSDINIYTNDNPRFEDEYSIILDIIKKLDNNLLNHKYFIELDRKKAIKKAISLSSDNDIICILGRGNDNYQYIRDEKIELNDYNLVLEGFKND